MALVTTNGDADGDDVVVDPVGSSMMEVCSSSAPTTSFDEDTITPEMVWKNRLQKSGYDMSKIDETTSIYHFSNLSYFGRNDSYKSINDSFVRQYAQICKEEYDSLNAYQIKKTVLIQEFVSLQLLLHHQKSNEESYDVMFNAIQTVRK